MTHTQSSWWTDMNEYTKVFYFVSLRESVKHEVAWDYWVFPFKKEIKIQRTHEEAFLEAFLGLRNCWGGKTSLGGIREKMYDRRRYLNGGKISSWTFLLIYNKYTNSLLHIPNNTWFTPYTGHQMMFQNVTPNCFLEHIDLVFLTLFQHYKREW